MIHVLLTSELQWQSNDVVTFFSCLCIPFYQEFFPDFSAGISYKALLYSQMLPAFHGHQ